MDRAPASADLVGLRNAWVTAVKHATALGPIRPIEDGLTRESLARDCREAALSFMSGVATGWDKLDLALWLTGPYAHATRHAQGGAGFAKHPQSRDEIAPASVELLVTRVRGQLLASLEKAALEFGTLDFTDEAVARGLVRKVVAADGRDAWVPVDAPRMRLRDRLRSLFTADFLNAPYTYSELFVCHRCEAVVFDDRAKRRGICGAHRLSGMIARNDDAPESVPQARSLR
jgi:hypothetical protein